MVVPEEVRGLSGSQSMWLAAVGSLLCAGVLLYNIYGAPLETRGYREGYVHPGNSSLVDEVSRDQLEQSCREGDDSSCELLGFKYAIGDGVQPSRADALRVWTTACKRGNRASCTRVASYEAQDNKAASSIRETPPSVAPSGGSKPDPAAGVLQAE